MTVTPWAPHTFLVASFLNLVLLLRLLHRILGESPALEVSKASGDGILGVTAFLKALLKNLLLLSLLPRGRRGRCAAPICASCPPHFGMSSWCLL
jgi:hypothetical protein